MSIQYSDKSTNFSSTTTNPSNVKTPFGIEDILFINNNNNNNNVIQNVNKNSFTNVKDCEKNAVKNNEAEEFKKILSSER